MNRRSSRSHNSQQISRLKISTFPTLSSQNASSATKDSSMTGAGLLTHSVLDQGTVLACSTVLPPLLSSPAMRVITDECKHSLAYAEMRLILARVLWNFNMKLADDDKVENWLDQKSWTFWEKGPLNVYLTKRDGL